MHDLGQKQRTIRFGTFELNPESGELRKDGAPVRLQSQQVQLLALLAARAGEAVSREDIRRALWDDKTFVDFDRSINFCVNQIRVALDDDPQRPRYIETLPRKGYRFIAPIAEPVPEPGAIAKPRVARLWWFAAVLVAIGVAAHIRALRHPGPKPIESLAVLPLENLSHDPDQDYFAAGMTDELITDLAKIGALRVISRTSVMPYRGTKKPLPQIARELNVEAVLEGTVTRDGGKVRITAQLIGAAPERHLWADSYEVNLGEVLAVQDAVAKAVAHQIQIKVTPREREMLNSTRAVDPEAYEAYLRGLYLNPTEDNLKKSLHYFQQAADKDAGYAPAWAQIAEVYDMMAAYGLLSRQEAAPRIRSAAERASQLDNNLVLPVVMLAKVRQNYEWDWRGAELEYKRAIGINPKDQRAHMDYSGLLAEVGRPVEAVAEARRAREVGPTNYWASMQVLWRYYLARQYDRAAAEAPKLIEWEPGLSWGYICQASVFLQTARQREALARLQKAVEVSNRGVFELMYLGHALGVSGDRAEGQKVLDEILGLTGRRYVPPEFIAVVYEGMGQRDRALQWFEKAYSERSMHSFILPDPRLDRIRTEPRFRDLMRRMGLPQ